MNYKNIIIRIFFFTFLLASNCYSLEINFLKKYNPNNCENLYKAGKFIEALKICRSVKDKTGNNDYYLGLLFMNKNLPYYDYNKAINHLKKSIKNRNKQAFLELEKIYVKKRNWQILIKLYTRTKIDQIKHSNKLADIYWYLYHEKQLIQYKNDFIKTIDTLSQDKSYQAKFYYGIIYQFGIGAKIDLKKAKENYESFIKRNNNNQAKPITNNTTYLASAQTNLGIILYRLDKKNQRSLPLLLQGVITKESSLIIANLFSQDTSIKQHGPKTIKWLKISISLGSTNALNKLSYLYEKGIFVKKNIKKSLELLEKSANNNNIQAMERLALIYENGTLVPRNRSLALKWYTLASKAGSIIAKKKIQSQLGISSNQDTITTCKTAYRNYLRNQTPRIASRTFSICNKVSNSTKVSDQYYRGLLYMFGVGTSKNKKKGLKLILAAAKKNYPSALYSISFYYYDGITIKNKRVIETILRKNIRKSIEYSLKYLRTPKDNAYMNPKQKRSAHIYWNLFDIYYNGIGVRKNMNKAVFYLKKSNSYQYSLATITLGYFYFSGKFIKKNISMAIGLWEKFASDYYKYHQSRFSHDFKHYKYIVEKLCWVYNSSDKNPQIIGKNKSYTNYKKAFKWCFLGAQLGSASSTTELAEMYFHGRYIPKDTKKAIYWLDIAAKKGSKAAKDLLKKIKDKK